MVLRLHSTIVILSLSLVSLLSMRAEGEERPALPEQSYIAPHLFTGSLYVGTLKRLDERQTAQLRQEFGRAPQRLVLIGVFPTEHDDHCANCVTQVEWLSIARHSSIEVADSAGRTELANDLHQVGARSCVWLREGSFSDACDQASRAWIGRQLVDCLGRGATVCVEYQPPRNESNALPAGSSSRKLRREEHVVHEETLDEPAVVAQGLSLLPSIELVYAPRQASSELLTQQVPETRAGSVLINLSLDAWVRIGGRELFNLSLASGLTVTWPGTVQYPEVMLERVEPRMAFDLVAARRALAERQQPAFPAPLPYEHRMHKGSLVIVGGGGAPAEVWEKFVTLAGGPEARIVVLPTAGSEPESGSGETGILKRFGAQSVRVLPQTDRGEVSKPEYLENFKWATGVWFGGGRQWRFVDAYWGTPAWPAILEVADRGGVIGGSSAGATIQGDLLVRGHPLGNQVMVADGYRRGLGLLPGVAIDQHFRQRNRFDDLASVVQRFPHVLGIGIDEATALVVEAPDKCTVIGQGSVWLSLPGQEPRTFIERTTGSSFELNANAKR